VRVQHETALPQRDADLGRLEGKPLVRSHVGRSADNEPERAPAAAVRPDPRRVLGRDLVDHDRADLGDRQLLAADVGEPRVLWKREPEPHGAHLVRARHTRPGETPGPPSTTVAATLAPSTIDTSASCAAARSISTGAPVGFDSSTRYPRYPLVLATETTRAVTSPLPVAAGTSSTGCKR
jgi:hypothetical protein